MLGWHQEDGTELSEEVQQRACCQGRGASTTGSRCQGLAQADHPTPTGRQRLDPSLNQGPASAAVHKNGSHGGEKHKQGKMKHRSHGKLYFPLKKISEKRAYMLSLIFQTRYTCITIEKDKEKCLKMTQNDYFCGKLIFPFLFCNLGILFLL